MRTLCALIAAAAVAAAPTFAKPPREESPIPRDLLAGIGDDAAEDAAIAAAASHPLGTLRNPVRVGGPEGERAYLSRLRCTDGSAPAIGRRASAGVGAFGSVTASYALDCGAAGKVDVVLDMYHEGHVETRAPAGLTATR